MSLRPTSRALRLAAAVLTGLLLIGSAVAVSRTRGLAQGTDLRPNGSSPDESDGGGPARPQPTPGSTPGSGPDLPVDPAAAEALGGDALLAAGRAAAAGDWSVLGHPDWPAEERPVYVATARLGAQRRTVDADVTIGFRAERDLSTLILRLLPAAQALADAGTAVQVQVSRDGAAAVAEVDHVGARLLVPLQPPMPAGSASTVRIRLRYRVPDRAAIADDGGPAGFGLLARSEQATVLGHWLPLLTIASDDGPMLPLGDVGAFPAAVWSLLVATGGTTVVTSGEEQTCPEGAPVAAGPGCVWSRGVALRDQAAVAYDGTVERAVPVGPVRVHALGPAAVADAVEPVLQVASAATRLYLDAFGALAWRELDVVAAPLGAAVAGMEFPGLIIIRLDLFARTGPVPGLGALVVAHEVAHQWFHALVGSGSLSTPVVDEAVAQYLAHLYAAAAFGESVARELAGATLVGHYQEAQANGLVDEPPAQPLAEFDGPDAYGALVYARAPLGLLAAEETAGRDAVVGFLAEVVDRFGLGFVNDDELVALAREREPAVAQALERYWFDPRPIG